MFQMGGDLRTDEDDEIPVRKKNLNHTSPCNIINVSRN